VTSEVVREGPRRSLRPPRRAVAALLSALVAAGGGCGYRLASGANRLPSGAERIFVRPLEARTGDPQAGALVAAALRSELARRNASAGPDARAHLEGVVEDASFTLASGNPPTYQLSLRVRARLVVDGKVLVERAFTRAEESLSGLDPLESEGRRRLALRRASAALARDVVEVLEQP
jgi:hypothetical protein